jgi:hypothetical protein
MPEKAADPLLRGLSVFISRRHEDDGGEEKHRIASLTYAERFVLLLI